MQLAYSTNAFTRHSLEKALLAIAELGFPAAEILCDKPHWFATETTSTEIRHVAALLDKLGLRVSNLNANTANGYYNPSPPENVFEPSLTNPDSRMRAWREQYTINAIHLAHQIGAHCISITTGRPTPGCPPLQAMEYFSDSLKTICTEAERYDIRIGIEYEPGLLVERATEAMEIIERVGSNHLGVNFDIGHSFLSEENPEQTIRLLSGRIWNVHIEDIQGKKHFHLIPGEGELPFSTYINALRDIGYSGYLTVELYSYPQSPVDAGRSALNYLTPLLTRET